MTMDSHSTIEMSLLDPEEREQLEYIWQFIPAEDRKGMTQDDVLFILDEMDNYLEEQGLLKEDEQTGEFVYLEGDVDETEQLNYVLTAAQECKRTLTSVQIQLVMEGEVQYGVEQGWYEEED